MRDVVERGAHRRHEALNLIEHRVEQPRQFVDRITGTTAAFDRNARISPARPDDSPDRLRQTADRINSRLRREPPAGQRHGHDEQGRKPQRRAEPPQQLVARFGTLADLHQRAISQPRRHGLELRRIPALGVAEHHRFDTAIDDPHEQPLGRDRLFRTYGSRQHRQPAASVGRSVVPQLGADDLMIALR